MSQGLSEKKNQNNQEPPTGLTPGPDPFPGTGGPPKRRRAGVKKATARATSPQPSGGPGSPPDLESAAARERISHPQPDLFQNPSPPANPYIPGEGGSPLTTGQWEELTDAVVVFFQRQDPVKMFWRNVAQTGFVNRNRFNRDAQDALAEGLRKRVQSREVIRKEVSRLRWHTNAAPSVKVAASQISLTQGLEVHRELPFPKSFKESK